MGQKRWMTKELHSAYSLDLVPLDYDLFSSLQCHLERKEFKNADALKENISVFLALGSQLITILSWDGNI